MMPKWLPTVGNRLAWRACDGLFVHSETVKRDLAEFMGGNIPADLGDSTRRLVDATKGYDDR